MLGPIDGLPWFTHKWMVTRLYHPYIYGKHPDDLPFVETILVCGFSLHFLTTSVHGYAPVPEHTLLSRVQSLDRAECDVY